MNYGRKWEFGMSITMFPLLKRQRLISAYVDSTAGEGTQPAPRTAGLGRRGRCGSHRDRRGTSAGGRRFAGRSTRAQAPSSGGRTVHPDRNLHHPLWEGRPSMDSSVRTRGGMGIRPCGPVRGPWCWGTGPRRALRGLGKVVGERRQRGASS